MSMTPKPNRAVTNKACVTVTLGWFNKRRHVTASDVTHVTCNVTLTTDYKCNTPDPRSRLPLDIEVDGCHFWFCH